MQRIQGKTFSQNHPHSCRDTITGECLTDTTAEECRDICKDSVLCDAAAWTAKSKECRPFYTEIYDYVNPLDSLKTSDDSRDVVFVDSSLWKYPSDTAGIVRTRDSFYLTTETGQTINTETTGEPLTLSDSGFVQTQFIFQDIHGPNGRVDICDSLLINKTKSNLLLRPNDAGGWTWEPALSDNTGILDLFTLVPETQEKCPGNTPVKWDGKYFLEHSGLFLKVLPADSKGKSLVTSTSKISEATLWKLKPKDFMVYYCDKNECREVSVERVKFKGETARYNGKVVYRVSSCVLQCETPHETAVSVVSAETKTGSSCAGIWCGALVLSMITMVLLVVLWVKANRNV